MKKLLIILVLSLTLFSCSKEYKIKRLINKNIKITSIELIYTDISEDDSIYNYYIDSMEYLLTDPNYLWYINKGIEAITIDTDGILSYVYECKATNYLDSLGYNSLYRKTELMKKKYKPRKKGYRIYYTLGNNYCSTDVNLDFTKIY